MKKRTDKERLEALIEHLEWDGYGYWLPEWCVKVCEFETYTEEPSPKEFREFLDSRLFNGTD